MQIVQYITCLEKLIVYTNEKFAIAEYTSTLNHERMATPKHHIAIGCEDKSPRSNVGMLYLESCKSTDML